MSQSQLAKAAAMPTASLKNYEQGRREPKLTALVSLAKALGVSLDTLAGTVEETAGQKEKATEPKRPAKPAAPPAPSKDKPTTSRKKK